MSTCKSIQLIHKQKMKWSNKWPTASQNTEEKGGGRWWLYIFTTLERCTIHLLIHYTKS